MIDARERALAAAREVWGELWSPTLVARAPGRLELLGNHVDYSGGRVLAAAIDRDVATLLAADESSRLRVVMSDADAGVHELTLADLSDWRFDSGKPGAIDYVRGVVAAGLARGTVRSGDLGVAGDVPIGFGLSSSAALCVALTLALHDPAPSGRNLVLAAQEAEHRVGTPCGTMDQAASVGGNVILFDSEAVTWEGMAPDLQSYAFVVANSGVSHALATSSYPTRVAETRDSLAIINAELKQTLPSLSAMSADDLAAALALTDETLPPELKRRVRHIVTERDRVEAGVLAMRAGDWRHFGELMTESGKSSAADYEISHPRVERIVELAHGVNGVLGARMMGGGEGGAALILADQAAIPVLRDVLATAYYGAFDLDAAQAVRVFGFAPGAGMQIAQ